MPVHPGSVRVEPLVPAAWTGLTTGSKPKVPRRWMTLCQHQGNLQGIENSALTCIKIQVSLLNYRSEIFKNKHIDIMVCQGDLSY